MWQAEIPPLPKAITEIANEKLRGRAEVVWRAGYTLLSAIDAWELMFDSPGNFDYERGDAVVRAARAALRVLRHKCVEPRFQLEMSELAGTVRQAGSPEMRKASHFRGFPLDAVFCTDGHLPDQDSNLE